MANVKKIPRRERGKMRIFSRTCGTPPEKTDIQCWVPLKDAMKVVNLYEQLMARTIREHVRRSKRNRDELKDVECLTIMANAHQITVEDL